MANPTPGVLRNLRIKRVALVDAGANEDKLTGDGAHIMLYKSKMGKGPDVGSVHVDSPDWDADDQDEYEKADLTAQGRRQLSDADFAAVWTDAQGKKHRKLPIHDAGHLAAARGRIDQASIPADVKAAARRKIEAATNRGKKEKNVKKNMFKRILGLMSETDVTKRTAAITEIDKAIDDMCDDDMEKVDPDPDDMTEEEKRKKKEKEDGKGGNPFGKADVDRAIAKALSDVEKRHKAEMAAVVSKNEELAKAVDVEKNNRLNGEMVEVLKGFRATPFNVDIADPKNDVAKFRKMKESAPEAYERTMEVLKATDAQLAQSALYANLGSGRTGQGSAWGQIEAKADSMMEKDTKGLTREQAIDKVMMDPRNNTLVKQYRAEQQ